MSRFGQGRHFFALFGGLMPSIILVFGYADPLVGWVIPSLGALGVGYSALAIGLYRIDNHGRGDTRRSRLQRRLARLLVGPIKPCGCWSGVGSDTVESEPYVRRSMDGAQVVLEARKRRIQRCEGCGRHYHDTAQSRTRNIGSERALKNIDTSGCLGIHREIVVWPEDEPEAAEHITAPIERD